jgi:hypothetical protein
MGSSWEVGSGEVGVVEQAVRVRRSSRVEVL